MPKLDPRKLPTPLISLLSMAERWGIGDDYDRERVVHEASTDDLNQLVHCIDGISDENLFGWLEGPESYASKPSDEYLAITCLTMARDSARVVLLERKNYNETNVA